MKKSYLIFLLLLTHGIYNNLLAQSEICNNGVDDDNDGFVDCYDNSCADSPACDDFFMGAEASCEVEPTEFPAFTMKKAWGSPNETAATWSRVSVGDVEGDGIPEIIVTNRQTNKMYVLNGSDGSIRQQFNLDYSPEHGVAMADLEGDGYAEFFISGRGMELEGYTYNPGSGKFERMWRDDIDSDRLGEEKGRPMVLGLADFKGTGEVQLYYKNEIRDAKTGRRIVNGTGNWEFEVNFAPVAVDILEDGECSDCNGLELVSGGVIYAVDLGDGTKDSGKLTVVRRLSDDGPGYYVKESGWTENFSGTSIADYNQDGYIDVIASGALNGYHGPTTVFFWDVKNKTVKTYSPSNNWKQGMGRPNIADIDGDGQLNITFVTGNKLFALDEAFNLLWEQPINEQTSGFTGTTVFDFNGDGAYEIVYRDERNLYIINGVTGKPYESATTPCRSRTSSEYPVVADVDGDGATEICVVCNTDDGADEQDGGNTRYGQVRVYESDGETWVPSRKVWNQHTYFNVNINDDLTIPREQQKHHLVFSDEDCIGSGMPNRPLNTFLNQSPYLNARGCLSFGAPDFTVLSSTLEVTPPVCPEKAFTLSFSVKNDGQLGVSGSVPVTFYEGNPKTSAGVKLNTVFVDVLNLLPGETFSVTDLAVNGTGTTFDLYIAFNDAGASAPPIAFPNGGLLECNYDNNILSSRVVPDPFAITVEKVKDNFKCDGAAPNNGAVRAYVLEGTNKVTAGYTFYWYDGTNIKPVADHEGAVYTGLKEGSYTVRAVNKAAGCGSTVETAEIAVAFQSIDSVEVEVIKNVTRCDQGNGELKAHVWKNGERYYEGDGYTFTWYKSASINDPDAIVAIGSTAKNLEEDAYSVVVTDNATGCRSIGAASVGSNLSTPVVDVEIEREITKCNQSSGGKLRASVDGNTSNYTFKWYDGATVKVIADGTAHVYAGLKPGEYTVVATHTGTGCASDPKTVTIGSTIADPEVVFTDTKLQTSCGTPNGELSIEFSTPAPGIEPENGYDIDWFRGQTTHHSRRLPSSKLSADRKTATALDEGWYTVRIINEDTDCATTAEIYLDEEIVEPEINAVPTVNTVCDDDFAPYNGSITATVTLDGTTVTDLSDYTFTWYKGHNTWSGNKIAGENAATLENRSAGTYTVVVERISTDCSSHAQTVEISDDITRPVIDITELAPQTHCDPATPNGELEVSVDGPLENYRIEWFEGNNTSTPLPAGHVSGTHAEKAINLSAGNYTVRVSNLATGCSRVTTEYLASETHTPVVSVSATDINTHCSDDYTSYDGSLTATVTVGGASADVNDYTFTWYEGDVTGTVITGENSAVLDHMPGGEYTVIATHKTLACASASASAEIVNNFTFPDIDITPVSHQSNCDPSNPNGVLSASVVIGNPQDYYFYWEDQSGNALPAANIGGTYGEEANHLTRGTYTVEVSHKITGCSESKSFTLEDKISEVAVSGKPFNNTICDPSIAPGLTYDGRILASVTVDGVPVDLSVEGDNYTFSWYDGGDPNTATPLSESGPELENLKAGEYTVYVMEKDSRCFSEPIVVEVKNEEVRPQITFTVTPQTHCDPATSPNGELLVSVDGPLEDYTIDWFVGQGTGTPLSSAHITGTYHEEATQLTAGKYTVKVTNMATGCFNTETIDLPNRILYPELELHPTTNTVCDPSLIVGGGKFTGSITAAIEFDGTLVTDFSDYTFAWYEVHESGPDTEITDNIEGHVLKGLDQGKYKVVVTKNSLQCTSAAAVIEIEDATTKPNVVFDNTPETHCDTPNGVLSASVNLVTTGYSFAWFDVNDQPIGTGPVLTGMASGDYSVKVVNLSTGCSSTAYTFLEDNIQAPVIASLTPVDNTICNPSLTAAKEYNGAVTADITFRGTPVTDFTDYTFQWYEGSVVDNTKEITANINGNSLEKLPAGYYTVTVTHSLLGCTSLPRTVEVEETRVLPDITIDKTAQTHCDPATPNGILSAHVGGVTSGYTFAWFEGDGIGTPLGTTAGSALDQDKPTAGNLPTGYYTVQVTNTATGCSNEKSIYLNYLDTQPVVTIDATTSFTSCNTPDGEITTSVSSSYAPDGYTYTWYDQTGTVLTGETASSVSGMEAGTYTVTATNDFTGCISEPVTAVIEDEREELTVVVAILEAQDCGTTSATGEINITSINGMAPTDPSFVSRFEFEWYEGRPDVPNTVSFTNPPLPGETGPSLISLPTNAYSVVITDNSNGCQTVKSYGVPSKEKESLDLVKTYRKHISSCGGSDGEIRVELQNYPTGYDADDYTFTWYKGNNVKATTDFPGQTTNILTGLEPGTYTAIATQNFGAGCSSAPLAITLYQVGQPPVVSHTIVHNSFCTGGDGQITISADTATVYGRIPSDIIALDGIADDDHLGYTFAWYAGETVAGGTPISTGITSSGTGSTIAGLEAGKYTVRVTNSYTTCFADKTYEIQDQPDTPVKIAVDVTHQTICNPSGAITVTGIEGLHSGSRNVSDYTYTWYKGSPDLGNVIPGETGLFIDDLMAGEYFVTATTATGTGLGCSSAPLKVEVLDKHVNPVIVFAQTPNTACNLMYADGALTATGQTSGAPVPAGSAFEWFNVASDGTKSPFIDGTDGTVTTTGNTSTISGVKPGTYSVRVTDDATGCSWEEQHKVEDAPVKPVISAATIVDQTICAPSGSITITDADVTTGDTDDYTFTWYRGSVDPTHIIAAVNGPELNVSNYPSIGADTYYVTITKNNDPYQNCISVAFPAEIRDESEEPAVMLAGDIMPNTFCAGGFDGSLTLEAGHSATNPVAATTFTYSWTSNTTTIPATRTGINPGEEVIFSGLEPGEYFVTVTSDATQCSRTVEYNVGEEKFMPVIDPAQVLVTHQDRCDYGGAIEITDAAVTASLNGVDDYTFTWYKESVDAAHEITGVTGPVLDLGNYPIIEAGTYWVVATKKSDPGTPGKGLGCASTAVQIEINDISEKPLLAKVGDIMPNTFCAGGFDGSITLEASHSTTNPVAAGTFTFTWTSNTTTTPATRTGVSEGTDVVFGGLEPGEYTVTVISDATLCSTTAKYTVGEQPFMPAIDPAQVVVTHQDRCDYGGAIEITDAAVTASLNGVNDYVFTWYKESVDAAHEISGVTGPVLDLGNYPSIEAGTYWVVATKKSDPGTPGKGLGCASMAVEIEIDNISEKPVVATVGDIMPNTFCAGFDGSITLEARHSTTNPVAATTFTYSWTSNTSTTPATRTGVSAGTDEVFGGLEPGVYFVTVTSDATLCSRTVEYHVGEEKFMPAIDPAQVVVTHQDRCDYGGGIEIIDAAVTASPNGVDDYVFTWYRETTDAANEIAGLTGPVLGLGNYPTIEAGTYWVVATKKSDPGTPGKGLGCASTPVQIEIDDISEQPLLATVGDIMPNTFCAGFDGSITLAASHSATNPVAAGTFTFTWTSNTTTTPATRTGVSEGTAVVFDGLEPGDYTVTVISDATLCQTTRSYTIEDERNLHLPTAISLTAVPQTICHPSGSITVEDITTKSGTRPPSDYTFIWYNDEAMTDPLKDGSGNVITAARIDSLNYPAMGSGTYYVMATAVSGTGVGCSIRGSMFVDDISVDPDIEGIAYQEQTRCDPAHPNGALTVSIDGEAIAANLADYEIKWYAGNVGDMAQPPGTELSTNNAISDRKAGDYTVQVYNTVTGCSAYKVFTIEDNIVTPLLNISTAGRSYCSTPNGAAHVTITNVPGDFIFQWYKGVHTTNPGTAHGSFIATSRGIDTLDTGDYTVFAIEQGGNLCDVSQSFRIEDIRVYPGNIVFQASPLTNCDAEFPEKANGQLSATVNGLISGYTFEWYLGEGANGTPFYVGPTTPSTLTNTTYTVRVIRDLTGCAATASYTLGAEQEPVPPPAATATDRTNCETPNGVIEASVTGLVNDFRFNWYKGKKVNPGKQLNETGPVLGGLEAGTYTVTVTSLVTGCTSPAVNVEVGETYIYPEFDIKTTNATCELVNGRARLEITHGNVTEISWDTDMGIINGLSTVELPAGTYTVTLTTADGCSTTKTFTIGSDVLVYNGLSPNGDFQNDILVIDCIQLYPSNNVKIFNRAGTLVFEIDGYDNSEKYFDGTGNRGIYVAGNELPDGTYFFVVEKNDGSEAKTGYLELIR